MTEEQLEQEALAWLVDVGYSRLFGPDIAPDGPAPERASHREIILAQRLRQAVDALNPTVPIAAREDAVKQVLDLGTPVLLAANRQFHRLLVSGVRGSTSTMAKPAATSSASSTGPRLAATSGWPSTSSASPGRTTRAGPTSSCSSTACRWCWSS